MRWSLIIGGKKKKDDTAYDSDDSQIEDSQSVQSEKFGKRCLIVSVTEEVHVSFPAHKFS